MVTDCSTVDTNTTVGGKHDRSESPIYDIKMFDNIGFSLIRNSWRYETDIYLGTDFGVQNKV